MSSTTPIEAPTAPRLSNNEMRSLKKTRASGMTNKGSVAPMVEAMATSRYLIDTSDSQKPPKVTTATENTKRVISRIFRTGISHCRIRLVARPKNKMHMVPDIIRISVAMIVETDSSAGLATTVDADIHNMETDQSITPRMPDRFNEAFDPNLGHKTALTPAKVTHMPTQVCIEGISPSQYMAIRAVTICPIMKNTTRVTGPRSCSAAKNSVSATAIPKRPLKLKKRTDSVSMVREPVKLRAAMRNTIPMTPLTSVMPNGLTPSPMRLKRNEPAAHDAAEPKAAVIPINSVLMGSPLNDS